MRHKITGEEKHYQKLNTRLQQELNQLTFRYEDAIERNVNKTKQIAELEAKVSKLEQDVEFLRNRMNLSDEDLQKLLRGGKACESLVGVLGLLNNGY